MNGGASRPDKPASFFSRFLTKCRNSALGFFVLAVVVGLTATGRWLMASVASSRALAVAEAPPTSIRAIEIADEVVESGTRYSAVVKELQKAELSFRVGGTVDSLLQVKGPGGRLRNLHEGDTLAKDTPIARLDQGDYERRRRRAAEQLATAEAHLAEAQSTKAQAELDLRRAEHLVKTSSMTVAEHDSARTKHRNAVAAEAAAKGQVAAARIELEQSEVDLKYCNLTVPFPRSTIAARYIENNERVAANQRAFLVIDVSSVVIAFNIPDTLVNRLSIGQSVEVNTDAIPGEHFMGVIHKIASTADAGSRTYPIEVRVDRPRGLRPGMVANVTFRHEARAYLLPLTAIVPSPSGGSFAVYRVVEDSGRTTLREVPVQIGGVLDNRVTILVGGPEGVKPGDRVVAVGTHRLHEGESVRVVE